MDVLDFARYFAALLLVLGLIGAAGIATRKFGVPGFAKPVKARRIQIVETLILSPRQKIALIRRDDVEHMVMITPNGATVIESGITPPVPQPVPASQPVPAPVSTESVP
jgi:flagellar protein FliO/FliZ